jgi:hypothetical protein
MSCRHQSDSLPPGSVIDAPSSARKWQRWPSRLPRACNDNPRAIPAQLRTVLTAALRELLTLATALMRPRVH